MKLPASMTKSRHYKSALIYYNEVLIQDPNSPYAPTALKRLSELKKITQNSSK